MVSDVNIDDDAQNILAVLPAVANGHKRELPSHHGLKRSYAVEEKGIHPASSKDAQAVSIPILFVVDAEEDGLTCRRSTLAFLHERPVALALGRRRETAANGVLLLTDGKRGSGPA